MELPSPDQIKNEWPNRSSNEIARWRETASQILNRSDRRLAAIVGPCSIHDSRSALEYASRLKQLSSELEDSFFPIMRVFIEKPRTRLGWKGILYDPHLDGSNDLVAGLRQSRELILRIAEIGVPCAIELLEPNAAAYFDDLIVWGIVGARTAASQPHRQMASSLSFPVGFKNECNGEIDTAVSAIIASQMPHSYIGINREGKAAALQSRGNDSTHLVLRGSDKESNFDTSSIQKAVETLKREGLSPRVMIDCSHGNSGKDPSKQPVALESVITQAKTNEAIVGFMLESHLNGGNQPLKKELIYGVSITDSCLGWNETEALLRSMSISSVQN